jgi:nicotinate-nucleotide pyrophosphorylase (carboxylating)
MAGGHSRVRSPRSLTGRRGHHHRTIMDWNSRRITAIIENALLEDRATRDATSYACVEANQRASATILAKQDCILAGLGCVPRILDVYAALDGAVLSHYEVTSHPEIFDGIRLHKGQTIAVIRHNARVILSCERVILNFLQRLSGIATLTRKFVDEVSGTKARILDTRKTVPGFRVLDKYGVRCGGGQNHRLDLSDGVLIKNNHIALAGGIVPALERANRNRRGTQVTEIEVRSLAEMEQALEHGAEAILLDNMSVEDVKLAVERCSGLERRIPLESSGGITLDNVRAYAETGVDFISVGALTHSAPAVDMSLRVSPV